MFDKLKEKIGRKQADLLDKHADGANNPNVAHTVEEKMGDKPVEASINMPLGDDDIFLTTAQCTDDPLNDVRYSKQGLAKVLDKHDTGGIVQGMEHLSVSRDPQALLKGTQPVLSIKCGPLLRFNTIQQEVWHGSVMVVVIDGESDYSQRPSLQLSSGQAPEGEVIHTQFGASFWRWDLRVPLQASAQRVSYSINNSEKTEFVVPARGEEMRIMFHSCNGFSLSVDQTKFNGPDPLWRDVLREHAGDRPFHVMLGGGDQIYCDLITRRCALLLQWLNLPLNEHKTAKPFTEEMRHELESFYFEHYCWWFRQGQFGRANRQIPMVNIWDDHDIIDGFGSYTDHFMSSPVFSGVGESAWKYYMLFQHQTSPTEPESRNPAWLYGVAPGPYIKQQSRNILSNFGPRTVFFGFDNRTERTKHQIVTRETYDKVFRQLEKTVVPGKTEHLIVLLGVPIAYPRLVWLEELMSSKAMSPLKVLGKTGVLSGMTQKFDEGIELLDDLNDHWTAKHHKHERNEFIHRLQDLARSHSVRITLLGGDVHLGSIGEFYSRERVVRAKDHRYIPNVISSAIVNTPPAEAVSNLLGRRNKVHHLDHDCDETQVPLFEQDVTGKSLNNKALLPRRNWCSIEYAQPGSGPAKGVSAHGQSEDLRCDAGSLKVTLNIEVDSADKSGKTKPYVYTVPSLDLIPHSTGVQAQGYQQQQQQQQQQPAAGQQAYAPPAHPPTGGVGGAQVYAAPSHPPTGATGAPGAVAGQVYAAPVHPPTAGADVLPPLQH